MARTFSRNTSTKSDLLFAMEQAGIRVTSHVRRMTKQWLLETYFRPTGLYQEYLCHAASLYYMRVEPQYEL